MFCPNQQKKPGKGKTLTCAYNIQSSQTLSFDRPFHKQPYFSITPLACCSVTILDPQFWHSLKPDRLTAALNKVVYEKDTGKLSIQVSVLQSNHGNLPPSVQHNPVLALTLLLVHASSKWGHGLVTVIWLQHVAPTENCWTEGWHVNVKSIMEQCEDRLSNGSKCEWSHPAGIYRRQMPP